VYAPDAPRRKHPPPFRARNGRIGPVKRLLAPIALAAALLAAAPAPGAGYASLLQPLVTPVTDRLATASDPREARDLGRALTILAQLRDGLPSDLRHGRRLARVLDRRFAQDAMIDPALEACWTDLRQGPLDERAELAAWAGRSGSDRGELAIARGLARFDLLFPMGDTMPTRARAAGAWLRALRAVERARRIADLGAPPLAPPPFAGLAPDFSLDDVNPNSPGLGEPVSPRDLPGTVTAWYFTRLT